MKRTLVLFFILICAVAQAQPAINGYDYTNHVFRPVSVDASGNLVLGGALSASVTVDLTSLNAFIASTTAEAHSLYLRSLTQSQGTVASPTNIVLGSETIGLVATVASVTTAVSANSAAVATTTGAINALRNENNARGQGTTASPSRVIIGVASVITTDTIASTTAIVYTCGASATSLTFFNISTSTLWLGDSTGATSAVGIPVYAGSQQGVDVLPAFKLGYIGASGAPMTIAEGVR